MDAAAVMPVMALAAPNPDTSDIRPADLSSLPVKQQADALFELLARDDRNSRYVIASRSSDGRWAERAVRAGQPVGAFISDNSDADWYISHNGFTGTRRRSDQARQVNAIMLDIDCHDGYSPEKVAALLTRLTEAIHCGYLPSPTVSVDTGRGAHLYYVLLSSTPARKRDGAPNEEGLRYLGDVTRRLAELVASAVEDLDGVEVDDAVYDMARVGRLPGTVNSATGTLCRIFGGAGRLWALSALARYRLPSPDPKSTRKSRADRNTGTHGRRLRRGGRALAEKNMLAHRLKMTAELQKLRGFQCEGHRDQMCFIFYNTATQLFGPQHARKMLETFNRAFSAPLPNADLDQIARTVDGIVISHGQHAGEQGFYPLTRKNIINRLGLTTEEDKELGFFENAKSRRRRKAREDTSNKKNHRRQEIVRLYSTCGLTQKEVADRVGCSLRTVSSTVTSLGLKRAKTWSLQQAVARAVHSRKVGQAAMVAAASGSQAAREGQPACPSGRTNVQISAQRVGCGDWSFSTMFPFVYQWSFDLLISGSIMSRRSLSSASNFLSPISLSSTTFFNACFAFLR